MYPPTTFKMPNPARTAIVHALRGGDGRRAWELSVTAISKLPSCTRSKILLFESAFLRNQIAPVDGTLLLPTAEFKIGCCSSASSWVERYRWVDSRAIRQMSYFVVGKEANVETPGAAAGGGAMGDQRRDTVSTVAG
jgi:hypothetical protein